LLTCLFPPTLSLAVTSSALYANGQLQERPTFDDVLLRFKSPDTFSHTLLRLYNTKGPSKAVTLIKEEILTHYRFMQLLQKLMIINPQRAQGYQWVFQLVDPTARVEVTHRLTYDVTERVVEERWLGVGPRMDAERYRQVS
jgi:hypothetical protein